MHKEKTIHTFEVSYQDINNAKVLVPIAANDFRIDTYLVFSINDEDICAFKNWNSVRRMRKESVGPPSEFTNTQIELLKKKNDKNVLFLKKPGCLNKETVDSSRGALILFLLRNFSTFFCGLRLSQSQCACLGFENLLHFQSGESLF